MIDECVFIFNVIVSVIGLFTSFFILLDNNLNKQTAKCVLTHCFGGLIWFCLLYLSILDKYTPSILEVYWKLLIVCFTIYWIKVTGFKILRI